MQRDHVGAKAQQHLGRRLSADAAIDSKGDPERKPPYFGSSQESVMRIAHEYDSLFRFRRVRRV
jgi:hypothetical protein